MFDNLQFERLLDGQNPEVIERAAEERYRRLALSCRRDAGARRLTLRKNVLAAAALLAVLLALIPIGMMIYRKVNFSAKHPPLVQSGSYQSVLVDESGESFSSSEGYIDSYKGAHTYNPKAPQHVRVSFDGKTYDCEYTGYSSLPNEFDRGLDIYGYASEGNYASVEMERETGNFRGIIFRAHSSRVPISPERLEEFRPRAVEIASSFIDTAEYELTVSDSGDIIISARTGYKKGPAMIYTFRKKIGDLKTSDMVKVYFSDEGELGCVEISDIGRFDGLNPDVTVDEQKLRDSVEELIGAEFDEGYRSYEVKDRWLSASLEGKLLIVSQIYVTLNNGNVWLITVRTEI